MNMMISSSQLLLLLLLVSPFVLLVSGQQVTVGVPAYFEAPAIGAYQYTPALSIIQPWTWTITGSQGLGGLGGQGGSVDDTLIGGHSHVCMCLLTNFVLCVPVYVYHVLFSPFDPPYLTVDIAPPSPNQYAFLQTSPNGATGFRFSNMSATLGGMTAGSSYNLSFWYAARSNGDTGNATQSTMTVYVGGVAVWMSATNITDLNGWTWVFTTFNATAANTSLVFAVVSTSDNDRSVLVDSVLVMPTGVLLPSTGAVALSSPNAPIAFSFEQPILNSTIVGASLQPYIYNPQPINAQQPWAWTWQQGGIALQGGPWDPPAPATPPSGSQYAYIQTNPFGTSTLAQSNMSTTVTGLTLGTTYVMSFFWGVRLASGGDATNSQMLIFVNGATVYTSAPNLTDNAGWTQNKTNPFTMTTSTSATIVFSVTAPSTAADHTILIDGVAISPLAASNITNTSSSSTGVLLAILAVPVWSLPIPPPLLELFLPIKPAVVVVVSLSMVLQALALLSMSRVALGRSIMLLQALGLSIMLLQALGHLPILPSVAAVASSAIPVVQASLSIMSAVVLVLFLVLPTLLLPPLRHLESLTVP